VDRINMEEDGRQVEYKFDEDPKFVEAFRTFA